MVEKDEKLIENQLANFNIEDMWENLTTHEDTSYLTSFEFVYETFRNKFMQKNYRQSKKLLIQ